jgi:Ring finger domain
MFLFRRHQARYQSERVANSENNHLDGPTLTTNTGTTVVSHDSDDGNEGTFMNTTPTDRNNTPDVEQGARSGGVQPRVIAINEEEGGSDDEDDSEGINRHSLRHTVSLAELEEERELARRRSSFCVLAALFVLFRLWIFAIQDGDFGLLLLCVMASSWTARWIRHNREHEEELDRRIANYIQNAENGTSERGRDSLRMLSFQAQLALAIMESQRQMMQGGYGHPDGEGSQNPGVSEEARAKWKKITYKSSRDKNESRSGSYGSVAHGDVVKPSGGDDEPHCSICLGEYEDDEELSTLPCGHIYHDECIGSWCSNHTRCPLCNTDLEEDDAV